MPGVHYSLTVAFGLIPLAIAIAVVRHGLFYVELVVNRAVVYGALTVAGLAALCRPAGCHGSPGGHRAVCATAGGGDCRGPGGCAVEIPAFVYGRLFGARRDPYEVVRRVVISVAAAESPDEALANLVSTVRDVLALPYVAVEPTAPAVESATCAVSGRPVACMEDLPAFTARGRSASFAWVTGTVQNVSSARRSSALYLRRPAVWPACCTPRILLLIFRPAGAYRRRP